MIDKRGAVALAAALAAGLLGWTGAASKVVAQANEGDPQVRALMQQVNRKLAASGLQVAVEQIEFFTIGAGRPATRLHQSGSRWVAGDPRRLADGDHITYLVDQSDGATTSGLTNAQTEAAIDRAFATWGSERCLKKVRFVKRADSGADPDIFDAFFGFGGLGNPFLADIVNAGWLPPAFFDAVGGPGGAHGILAFTVSYVFVDDDDNPTDINGDNMLDTALAEVYYNDNFGNPVPGDRVNNPWGININRPGIDVETVALHENGHALELGHFGPPPAAVMNPVYAGIRHSPLAVDEAGLCTVWGAWPK
jgi:Matrixin